MLSMSDLDLLIIGMVLDIWTEKGNDDYKYGEKDSVRTAVQKDFDNYRRICGILQSIRLVFRGWRYQALGEGT